MANFHHHPDGRIFVRTDAGNYFDTMTNFEADLGRPYPGLPQGYAERYYEPGVRHFLATRSGADPQPLPWPEGDSYIAAYNALVAAKAARGG